MRESEAGRSLRATSGDTLRATGEAARRSTRDKAAPSSWLAELDGLLTAEQ